MTETALPTRKRFLKEGVVVNIPGRAKPIQAQRISMPKGPMPSVPGGFKPIRLVINLKIVDAAPPNSEVFEFDPPIEIRVSYTADDDAKAKAAGGKLSLGFWDGRQWNRFTSEKHQFRLEPAASTQAGGWASVIISSWTDPTVAVGS